MCPRRVSVRAWLWLVVALSVWRAVIVLPHTHLAGPFQANCPACQLEKCVSHAAPIATGAELIAPPVALEFLTQFAVFATHGEAVEFETPPRGPPSRA
jgi:hypothetical protein